MADRPNGRRRPGGGPGGPGRRRRVVIDRGAARPRPDARQPRERDAGARPRQAPAAPPSGPVTVESGITVSELSQALGVRMPEIIKILMGLGTMKTATQSLADDEVELIAAELRREVSIKHAADEDPEAQTFEDSEQDLKPRPPVVTI